jgi:signal transduction histidine kinase
MHLRLGITLESAGYRGVLALIWASALGALVFTWYLVTQRIEESRVSTLTVAERDLANLTRVSQEHALRTLRGADQVIRFVQSRYLEIGNKLNLQDLAQKGVIDTELFNQVGIIDPQGIYILANRPIPQKLDLSDREHFQVHVPRDTGELFISKPLLGRATQKWSIQMTRRITRPDGSFGGVVVLSIDPGYFTRFYGELNLGGAGMSALYGTDGIARARRVGTREEYGTDATAAALFKAPQEGSAMGTYMQRSVVDGVERMYFYRKIPGYNLLVLTGLDMKDLMAAHNRSVRVFQTQAALASLLMLALAAAITRHVLQTRRELQAKQASQEALQERTDQLHAIFELSPDGLVSFDQDHRVQYVNPAFLQATGLEVRQLLGQSEADFSATLAQCCTPNQRFPGIASLRSRVLARQPNSWEQIEINREVRCTLQVSMRFGASRLISQILYFHDVTREAEIDQMKSDFLATAAHELRTPMASIYGFSEVLLSQEFDPQEQRELLGIVYNQSKAMSEILNELLDLARIEARRGKDFRFNYLCLQTLVLELTRSTKIPEGRMAPALHMPTAEIWIMADAGKLKQAIQNVISNAYKYSPDGGAVDLSIEEEGSSDAGNHCVNIHVSDYGIGMSPEQARRVFERFYRADTSGKIPGTGLGMSIVKEIVELHHGSVSVQSHLGQGTRITLSLPVNVDSSPSA